MADDFKLPADPAGARVTINITADQHPYVDLWYLAHRSSPSETLAQFVLRTVVSQSLNYRHTDLLSQDKSERRTAETTEEATRNNDFTDESARLGG